MKLFFERLRSRRLSSAFVLLGVLSAAIVAGSYAAHGVSGQENQNASADATPLKVVNTPVPPNSFVKIAKEVGPAVVNINTQTLPKQSAEPQARLPNRRMQPQNPDGDDGQDDQDNGARAARGFQDFFNHFFGGQIPDQGDDGSDQVRESLGSGFIVDPKGYIVTNDHVVDKADKIYVKLSTDPDNQDLGRPARVIGVDKATDLAVIKIDTNVPLPTVKMGNSDMTQVGDWVEAIGSPFALAQTVTAGIVSAKNRTIEPGAPRPVPAFHSDRCRHQPRQLRRTAAEHEWRGDRRQYRHLHPVGRLPGHRLRHAFQYRGQHLQRPDQPQPQSDPRIHRHPVPQRAFQRGQPRLRLQERRPGAAGSARRSCGQGRPQARRHHHQHRWPRGEGRR